MNLALAVAPAWSAEPGDVAEPATVAISIIRVISALLYSPASSIAQQFYCLINLQIYLQKGPLVRRT
jgi:hypothetical protein